MTELDHSCPSCGESVKYRVVEAVWGDEVRCNGGYRCLHCGSGAEDCGFELTDDIRQAIIAEEGGYVLWVGSGGDEERVRALKALREALELDLPEAAGLKERIPGDVRSGTRVEMELVAKKLKAAGLEVRVAKA